MSMRFNAYSFETSSYTPSATRKYGVADATQDAADEREAITGGREVPSARTEATTCARMDSEDLAERSGMNVVQISHLERGRNEAKMSTILRLAKAFGITAQRTT